MIVVNIADLDDSDFKDAMMGGFADMRKSEERMMIRDAETQLASGKMTKPQIIEAVENFMSMWEPGSREWYYLPRFVSQLCTAN